MYIVSINLNLGFITKTVHFWNVKDFLACKSWKKLYFFSIIQLEDTRRLADAESRDRATLLGKFRNLESDLERLGEKIEAENEAKAEIQKAMSRAVAEAQVWKSKFNTEAVARIDDLENARSKLIVSLNVKIFYYTVSYTCPVFLLYALCRVVHQYTVCLISCHNTQIIG